jgi:PAS domain S-box-containing protein/diguanylate cyclase (GGDEF)-like protein
MSEQTDQSLSKESTTIEEVSITSQEYDKIFNIQQQILEMMASNGKTFDILDRLCIMAENLLPNSVASIMMQDKQTHLLNVLTAPSIPQAGHDALSNLKPGPGGGSCGNAVFHNEPQFVLNAFEEKRWENIRQIAYDFNLCSCWSMPIRDNTSHAIGSFALSSFEHRSPAPFHKKLLETGAAIVNIVLQKQLNNKRLQLFSKALQSASEAVIITDKDNRIIEVNPAFERTYGYKEAEVINRDPKFLAANIDLKKFYQQMWQQINADSKWSGELVNRRADGEKITQWTSISLLYDENNEVQNYLAIYTDLTELKNTQEQIEQMAFHDSVTGLYNKTYLEHLIKSGDDFTLILLNINNFSYINTAYGFDLGDKLLVHIARMLQNKFDSYSTHRLNSDEFAFLFKNKIDIKARISQIQNYFYTSSIQIDEVILNISFTYGASYGNKSLLRNSALALKQAKESGKNRFHVFNQDEDSIDHLQRESFIAFNNVLHDALEEDKLIPFFQGIRDNTSHEISKFEALVRIEKEGEIISPGQFLEPARLSGLLPEITKVMIDKSFKIMSFNDYIFSINITEDDLSRNYLNDYLELKMTQYKINPQRVILEMLEGVSSTGKKNHIKQLSLLKSKGFALAIDDFGAEYSNFERILDLEIDYLKIDAKYIKDIDTNPKSYEITRAIAYFAKNANIPCIAEFVHNASIQKIIDDLEIEFSQGFYFSEPNKQPQS